MAKNFNFDENKITADPRSSINPKHTHTKFNHNKLTGFKTWLRENLKSSQGKRHITNIKQKYKLNQWKAKDNRATFLKY